MTDAIPERRVSDRRHSPTLSTVCLLAAIPACGPVIGPEMSRSWFVEESAECSNGWSQDDILAYLEFAEANSAARIEYDIRRTDTSLAMTDPITDCMREIVFADQVLSVEEEGGLDEFHNSLVNDIVHQHSENFYDVCDALQGPFAARQAERLVTSGLDIAGLDISSLTPCGVIEGFGWSHVKVQTSSESIIVLTMVGHLDVVLDLE